MTDENGELTTINIDAVPNVGKDPEAFREWIHLQLDKVFKLIESKKTDNTDLDYEHVVYVGVDGSIGVGKSTLCDALRIAFAEIIGGPMDQHICLQEHVNAVCLKAFYADPCGMATLFQNNQCQNCLRTIREALLHAKLAEKFSQKLILAGTAGRKANLMDESTPSPRLRHSVVVDRTGFGNFSFAAMHVSLGNISLKNFNLYTEILAEAGEAMLMPFMIYLDAPLKTIHARIQKRAEGNAIRECEKGKSGVSLEYLAMLDVTMKAVFEYLQKKYPTRTLRLDWSEFGNPKQIAAQICDLTKIKIQLI